MSYKEMLNKHLPTIHPSGYVNIAIFLIVSILLFAVSNFLGSLGLILTAWCIYFFRDPKRFVPQDNNLIVSPADGIVAQIKNDILLPEDFFSELTEDEQNQKMQRVSIFLSLFDCHINRAPIKGKVKKITRKDGYFLNASSDQASESNQRSSMLIESDNGHKILVVQLAGLIARRILCFAKEGQDLQAGERFGIIKFGSRVDIYIPQDIAINVNIGSRVIAGETIIADHTITKNQERIFSNI